MWIAFYAIAASAQQDLYNVDLGMWSYTNTAYPQKCWIRAYFTSREVVTNGFYVDFFVNRPTAPAFGEWGDYWIWIDPVTVFADVGDDIILPLRAGSWDRWFFLDGVGEVSWDRAADGSYAFRANIALPDDPVARWWDVIVDTDALVTESSYANNHAELFSNCL